jgi:hypothetical protein
MLTAPRLPGGRRGSLCIDSRLECRCRNCLYRIKGGGCAAANARPPGGTSCAVLGRGATGHWRRPSVRRADQRAALRVRADGAN